MSIFTRRHTIKFSTPDPLANGLNDDIAAEQKEADAFLTLDDVSSEELTRHWNAIVKDIKKDGRRLDFGND